MPAGEVHAILGENGAGKSTLMNVATGDVAAGRGSIVVRRAGRSRADPELATTLGSRSSTSTPRCCPDMTVLENLQVALPASVLRRRRRPTARRSG